MAKLYFYYSSMNAGKSTLLLQHNHNNKEKKIQTLILVPGMECNNSLISSRIGISEKAVRIDNDLNLFIYIRNLNIKPQVILIDEVQFLTKKHIFELIAVVDILNIDVFAYGLRTDFKSKLFDSSMYLLAYSDKIIEIKSVCKCGAKAIMNVRIKGNKKINKGNQIDLDKNKYISCCRYHYYNFNLFDK